MTNLQHGILNGDFLKSKRLCQRIDGLCSSFDLRSSNVMSSPLPLRRPEISLVFCRCAAHLKLRKKIAKFDCEILNIHPSLCLFSVKRFVHFRKYF